MKNEFRGAPSAWPRSTPTWERERMKFFLQGMKEESDGGRRRCWGRNWFEATAGPTVAAKCEWCGPSLLNVVVTRRPENEN